MASPIAAQASSSSSALASTASASSSSSLSPGAALIEWVRPFGLDESRTGLVLWEGRGPEERGLRAGRKMYSCTKRTDADDATDGFKQPERCEHCAPQDASSLAAWSSSSSSYGAPPCAHCFPSPPPVAPVISIPSGLLITPARIRSSPLASSILSPLHSDRASDSQLLAIFLVTQHRLGTKSKWHPYIASLPRSYTSVEWWTDREVDETQSPAMREDARRRRNEVRREWSQLCAWLREKQPALVCDAQTQDDSEDAVLPLHWTSSVPSHSCVTSSPCTASSLCCLPTLAEFQWGWSTVATRSCFLPPAGSSSAEVGAAGGGNASSSFKSASATSTSSARATPVARDRSCLIPFLDMLNHSAKVSVECRLTRGSNTSNGGGGSYELWMTRPSTLRLHAGSELHISYGPLGNLALLSRYGFALANNEHDECKLTLNEVEGWLRRGNPLLNEKEQASLRAEWPAASPDDSPDSSDAFAHCTCPARIYMPSALSSSSSSSRGGGLPRYTRLLPGFPAMASWQLALLRACGLYELAEALEEIAAAEPAVVATTQRSSGPRGVAAASAKASPVVESAAATPVQSSTRSSLSFTLVPCIMPSDLATFIRVRVLFLAEAQQACVSKSMNANGGSKPSSSSGSSRSSAVSPSAASLDFVSLASTLLNEDAPHFSPAHQLLSQRVLNELVVWKLRQADALGQTTMQEDLRMWGGRLGSTAESAAEGSNNPATSNIEPLPYVSQQALLLRLTQKRLLYSLLAHGVAAPES